MICLASIGLGGPGLWADELATWGMTTVSWSETWRQLGGTDATLGAYYVLMRLWSTVFGDSDIALRVPSALAMAGSAALVARIGSRLLSARAGLTAGLVFAVLPVVTRFGQEARPYALAVFFGALATLLFVRMMDRLTFWTGVGYAITLTALGYTHLIAVLLVGAHGLTLLLRRRQLLWRWVPTTVIGLLPLVPLLALGASQNAQIDWIERTGLHSLLSYGDSFFGSEFVGGAVLVIGLAGLARNRVSVLAASIALVPAAALFAVGAVTPLWQPRYLLFTLVGWVLLAAATLERRTVGGAVAAVACLAAISVPAHLLTRTPQVRLQDTKAAAALINRDFQAGDGIVYGERDRGPGALNRDIITHYLPPERRPKDLLVQRPMRTDGWMVASECPDVAACIGSTARIWVLRLGDYPDPIGELDGAKTDILRRDYTVTNTWQTTGLTVALLSRTRR